MGEPLPIRRRRSSRTGGVALRAGTIVFFEHRDAAQVEVGAALACGRLQRSRVPGAAHDRRGRQLAPGAPVRDAVGGFGGIDAVKPDRRERAIRGAAVGVEDDQAMTRRRDAFGVRRAAGVVFLRVVEAKAQSLLGEQALHEDEVRLAVLHAGGACREHACDVERKVRSRVVGEHFGHDVLQVLVGVDEAVAAQVECGQPGLQMEAIAREAAVAAQCIGADQLAVPGAGSAIGQQQSQREFFADQAEGVEAARRGEHVDLEPKERVDRFEAAEALDHDRIVRDPGGLGRLKGDEAGALRELRHVEAADLPSVGAEGRHEGRRGCS